MGLQLIKAGAAIALAFAGMACGPVEPNDPIAGNKTSASPAQPVTVTPAAETATVKSGKDLYTINCLTCHKASGKGGKITVEGKTLDPDDLTSANMKAKTDQKLYNYIADGIVDEGMPAFKDTLTPEEIRAVVAHVRVLQQ